MVAVDEEVSYGLKKGVYYNSSSSSMSVLCCGSSFGLVVFIKKKSFLGGWGVLCTLLSYAHTPSSCLLGCVSIFRKSYIEFL